MSPRVKQTSQLNWCFTFWAHMVIESGSSLSVSLKYLDDNESSTTLWSKSNSTNEAWSYFQIPITIDGESRPDFRVLVQGDVDIGRNDIGKKTCFRLSYIRIWFPKQQWMTLDSSMTSALKIWASSTNARAAMICTLHGKRCATSKMTVLTTRMRSFAANAAAKTLDFVATPSTLKTFISTGKEGLFPHPFLVGLIVFFIIHCHYKV